MTEHPEHDRIPPECLAAEQALIGSAMTYRDVRDTVLAMVPADDFYAPAHVTIWENIVELSKAGKPTDKITLTQHLRTKDLLKRTGAPEYLSTCMDAVETVSSATHHAELVREAALCRRIIALGHRTVELGYQGQYDVPGALSQLSELYSAAVEGRTRCQPLGMAQVGAKYSAMMANIRDHVYATPWPQLDRYTGGFMGGELVAWASDPGGGKSMMVTQLAAYIAERYGHVAFFATEMGDIRTYARILALYSGVSARDQRYPERYTERQRLRVLDAKAIIDLLPITLIDPPVSTEEVVSAARRLHRVSPLRAIFVDTLHFLGDIDAASRDRSSAHDRQKRSVNTLVRLAQELMVPVHVVCHFRRHEGPGKAKPSKDRIRDGGNIEGTATSILFPWTDEEDRHWLVVDKAREGERAKLEMRFDGSRATWLQLDQPTAWLEPPAYAQEPFEGLA